MAKAEYRSAIRSRKLIQEALADLLQEKPLEKITVTDVVNRADINRGTFYAHYANIPDVVNHLIHQTFSSIQDVLSRQTEPATDVTHTLLTHVQSLLEEDMSFYQKITNSSAAALIQKQLVEITVEYFLQNKGAFSPGDPELDELTIRFCAGGISNLYQDWFDGKLPYTLDELTKIVESMIHRIISNVR